MARASKVDAGLTRLCCCCRHRLATGQRSGQRSLSDSPHLCFSPLLFSTRVVVFHWTATGKEGIHANAGWPLVLWLTAVAAVTHRVCLPASVANFNSASYLVPGHGCENHTHWFFYHLNKVKWLHWCLWQPVKVTHLKIPIGVHHKEILNCRS